MVTSTNTTNMKEEDGERSKQRKRFRNLLCDAAAKAVKLEDPWAKHDIAAIPAERVIRHLYDATTKTWSTDETIVKIEKTPFTNGAMRFCYRMKMKAPPPASVTSHRFHSYGWNQASNFIAKAYMVQSGENDETVVDVSEEAKRSIQNDVALQYESQHWAEKFNNSSPPKSILFIRAYAIEFPDRPGRPWMAIERFISGKGEYGASFVKHNTNSGFVDTELLNRVTPQLFSAYSFYVSNGERLVADIQGVGNLFTDPQVLSSDYRFGDADLGPRGMALFFKTFKHSNASDAMGIPTFPLSKNEIGTESTEPQAQPQFNATTPESHSNKSPDNKDDKFHQQFAKMDLNRLRRSSIMAFQPLISQDRMMTLRTSNISNQTNTSPSRMSMSSSTTHHSIKPDTLELDEVKICLDRSRHDLPLEEIAPHRAESLANQRAERANTRRKSMVRKLSPAIPVTDVTKQNLGKVHYQLAVLHGMGRFQEAVMNQDNSYHDASSVLFHLSFASALQCAPACLALARVHAGLNTVVSNLINSIVSVDFEAAKILLRRAIECPSASVAPKAAAICLLVQIYRDEQMVTEEQDTSASDTIMTQVIMEALELLDDLDNETTEIKKFNKSAKKGHDNLQVHDHVEANYLLEGNFYPAVVIELCDNGFVKVAYDEDGSTETLERKAVRVRVLPTATQTNLGGPLSDEEVFGGNTETDDKILLQVYELKAELAVLKEKAGDMTSASLLFEEAAEGAVANNNMRSAAEWSLKAEQMKGVIESG